MQRDRERRKGGDGKEGYREGCVMAVGGWTSLLKRGKKLSLPNPTANLKLIKLSSIFYIPTSDIHVKCRRCGLSGLDTAVRN